MEKRKFLPLPGLELRPFGRPLRSQSLYRLRYPGSPVIGIRNVSEFFLNKNASNYVTQEQYRTRNR
jgi:hypothetical protein